MPGKIELDEKYVVNEYKKGKSSLQLVKELGVSKPTILKVLNKHNVVRKRNRCDGLNIVNEKNGYYINRSCPRCQSDIKTTSKDKTIACRNYFNAVNKQSLCKKCSLEEQVGKGNPFYGKTHSDKSKKEISKSRKGKSTGKNNPMTNPKHRERAKVNLKDKWDNGEMEHVRQIMSDTLKKTRKLGKIKSVIRSKKEKEIIREIRNMGYVVKHSHRIETKICDIFIPKLNLIIEYNGDYWHCNPDKYDESYYHQIKGKTAKELWEYDNSKIDLIKSNGYNLEVVWETELKNDHTIIKQIIKKYDK